MRTVCFGCVVVVLFLGLVATASAAPCGQPGAAGEEPTYGTLTLKAAESEPNVNAGRKTGERKMLFLYDVSECSLPADEEIKAKVRSPDLDAATVFGPAESELDRSLLIVEIPVHPKEFEPGKHSAIVTVGGPNISAAVSKSTVQRSENRWWIPAGIAILAAILALAALVGRVYVEAKDAKKPTFHLGYLLLALLGALVGAALVYKSTYLEPEIWESDFGHEVLLFFAAAAAAGGASTLALVNKVWTKAD